jgi:N-succinyldiaminopimelate aminotransferase
VSQEQLSTSQPGGPQSGGPQSGRPQSGRPQSGRPLLSRRLQGLGTTIFAEMSARAVATGSINLGQGFPDRDGPAAIARAAAAAILTGHGNQYLPGPGLPELRRAIAAHQQRFYQLKYDPDTEVLVTTGAT